MTEFENLSAHLPRHISQLDVERVLRAVLSESEAWNWFARARIPFPFVVTILRALDELGYIEFEPTRLSGLGDELVRELKVRKVSDSTCPTCGGSGVIRDGLEQAYADYLRIFDARPRGEEANLDQGAMTPESLFRRLGQMTLQGDVGGKEIVVLGDDDLASLALALTGLPAKVTVLELDTRICDYISKVANDLGLNIMVLQQDLTKRLPEKLYSSFDTFVCDPPETESGLLLFVEKGLVLLKLGEGHAGYFGATVMEASLSKWGRWQRTLLNGNDIAITHILPPFTEYVSWPDEKPIADLPPLARLPPHPWYRFAFYRLETLPTFKPAQDFEVEHSKLLYFDEESYYEAFKSPRASVDS